MTSQVVALAAAVPNGLRNKNQRRETLPLLSRSSRPARPSPAKRFATNSSTALLASMRTMARQKIYARRAGYLADHRADRQQPAALMLVILRLAATQAGSERRNRAITRHCYHRAR